MAPVAIAGRCQRSRRTVWPLERTPRRGAMRERDELTSLGLGQQWLPPSAGPVAQPIEPLSIEASQPLPDRLLVAPQVSRDRARPQAFPAPRDHECATNLVSGCQEPAAPRSPGCSSPPPPARAPRAPTGSAGLLSAAATAASAAHLLRRASPPGGREDQVRSGNDLPERHRLALPQLAETGAEGMPPGPKSGGRRSTTPVSARRTRCDLLSTSSCQRYSPPA